MSTVVYPEFTPEVTVNMSVALERLCKSLELLVDPPAFELVALKIIELAAEGATDPNDVCRRVLSDFEPNAVAGSERSKQAPNSDRGLRPLH